MRGIGRMGLAGKMIVPFLIVCVALVAALGVVFAHTQRAAMTAQLEKKAEILARNLAIGLATPFSIGEITRLQVMLDEARQVDTDVAYAVLVDTTGRLVARGEAPGLSAAGRAGAARQIQAVERFTRLAIPGAPELFEVAMPVQYGINPLGTLRIGVTTEPISRLVRRTQWALALIGLGALVVGALEYGYAARVIARPVREAVASLEDLARGEGDLTHRLPVTSSDEIGRLAGAFNTFLEKLHRLIGQLASASARVDEAAGELASGARQMAAGAGEQTAKTTQAASAIEEMAATALDVARNATAVRDAARDAAGAAGVGMEIVARLTAEMGTIAGRVKETAQVIARLGRQSTQIGEIVGVITEVAEQTNLLALNAAIEAARAGEQGQGFSVVADEVRKLAERTAKATTEIAEMIRAIQRQSEEAVSAMEDRTIEAEKGAAIAREGGEAIERIRAVVGRVLEQVEQIAAAAQEQSAGTEEISSSVEGVATIAKQAAAGTVSTAKAAGELSKLAAEMRGIAGSFKL
jgi:methyl-accepting chemotaxis protein